MEQMAHTMVQTIQKGLWKTSPDRLRELQKLENELHAKAEARKMERENVESGKDKATGTVMKKETLSDMPDTTRTIVTTSAVLAIVILAGVLLVFIIRKRRKEEEEWKP
jgi:cobaltochelatase CobN